MPALGAGLLLGVCQGKDDPARPGGSSPVAVVKIDYILLGKPLSTPSKLVQENCRWYSEGILDNVRKSHQQLSQPIMAQVRSPTVAGGVASKD